MAAADAAQVAARQFAARRLARLGRDATRAAAALTVDADVVATVRVPRGSSGDDVAQAVAEAAETSAVTVVVLRNTTAP